VARRAPGAGRRGVQTGESIRCRAWPSMVAAARYRRTTAAITRPHRPYLHRGANHFRYASTFPRHGGTRTPPTSSGERMALSPAPSPRTASHAKAIHPGDPSTPRRSQRTRLHQACPDCTGYPGAKEKGARFLVACPTNVQSGDCQIRTETACPCLHHHRRCGLAKDAEVTMFSACPTGIAVDRGSHCLSHSDNARTASGATLWRRGEAMAQSPASAPHGHSGPAVGVSNNVRGDSTFAKSPHTCVHNQPTTFAPPQHFYDTRGPSAHPPSSGGRAAIRRIGTALKRLVPFLAIFDRGSRMRF